ncbi:MAG: hypothetical protein GF355_13255 [Candidatus Eisenbacteria bacterium]|nr:hypothetical protein [Candidatus Eisenbacteria bacterium]
MSQCQEGPDRTRPAGSYLFFPLLLVVLALASGLLTQACREQTTLEIDRNLPPETVLTGVPGDSTSTHYYAQLHWYGADRDGHVVAYEFAVTDSIPEDEEDFSWQKTTKTDSIFAIPVGENQEIMGRRFYVRAIDNSDAEDPTPAWTFFTVRDNVAPEIEFTRSAGIGPGGEEIAITEDSNLVVPEDTIPTGYDVEFAWFGTDGDISISEDGVRDTVGKVVGYSYHLAPIESSYLGGSLADTTASYDNLVSGTYTMFVRGIDDAGFSALNPTTRSFVWNLDPITHFEGGVPPGETDSMPHFLDGDDNEYFHGDTLARTGTSRTVKARIIGWDPDDPSGQQEVTSYEYRLRINGGGRPWSSVTSPDQSLVLEGLKTGNYDIFARCTDLLGRTDGSPAVLTFYVNKAPFFTPEVDVGVPILQIPQDGQEFTESEVNPTMQIRFIAKDPDAVAGDEKMRFAYKIVAPRDYFEVFYEQITQQPVSIGSGYWLIQTDIQPRRQESFVPRSEPYTLDVQVTETPASDEESPRSGTVQVDFYVTSG